MQGYCAYCRTNIKMKRAKVITLKNGKRVTLGICPICGSEMFRIGRSRRVTCPQ